VKRDRKWLLIGLLAVPLLAMFVVALAFPYLAVNAPSGASVAVVEGWIPKEHIPAVEDVIDSLGYERIYVTGTIRPCSYTLRIRDTLVLDLTHERSGELVVNACGSRGAGFVVMDGEGVLLEDSVADECQPYRTTLDRRVGQVLITPSFKGRVQEEWELLYLASVTLDGTNLHALQRNTIIHRQEGSVESGTPTYADVAVAELLRCGHDPQAIIPLRTLNAGESRTWANAKLFALRASRDGIKKVDVISFGIHARRSRVTYRTACGAGVQVGVVSIPDPEVGPGFWWHNVKGWIKVLKELGGVPSSYLVDGLE
jgi:hypothetical protein